MAIREDFAAALTTALPARRYLIVPNESTLATLDRRTIRVSQQGFAPFPEAPLSHITVKFLVRVISPIADDIVKAEADLDDAVSDVCFAIEGLDGFTWTGAEKVTVDNRNLAYDVTAEATTRKRES